MKSLSYKRRIMQNAELARFDMPTLNDNYSIGRSADHIEREAYEKGYTSGEKAGFEMGEQKARGFIDRLDALLADIATLRARIVKEVEPQCLELAVGIARKILIRELTTKPDEIVKMAKEGLLKLERSGQITIKVNPLLYDFFAKHRPDFDRIHPDIAFDADPSVSRYGTVVMGPAEEVVTGLDEQIKNLIKDLSDRLAHD